MNLAAFLDHLDDLFYLVRKTIAIKVLRDYQTRFSVGFRGKTLIKPLLRKYYQNVTNCVELDLFANNGGT